MADDIAYTRSVGYVRIWLRMTGHVIAELTQHQGIQMITPQQLQDRAYTEATQIAASTPQQFDQIINYGHQNVITFYDAIGNLFRLFDNLTNQEVDLEY